MKEILEEELPGVHLSISHEVVPQHREYERFSTTALDAYIGPKTSRYLRNMHDGAARRRAGHRLPPHGVQRRHADGRRRAWRGRRSCSCPARSRGSSAASPPRARPATDSVITLDVGGTSADIGVAPDAVVRMKHLYDTNLGGYEVMIPMVDLDTIGAGGGSLARVDAGGLLRGRAAERGRRPGPVCYGRGGTEPAATDAQAVLGRMRRGARLGGRPRARRRRRARPRSPPLGEPLGLDVTSAALGITQILTQNMVNAISVNSVQKGFDPRDFSLVAFGGGGPLYGADIARELSIPRVIVPPHPGHHLGDGPAGLRPQVRGAADRHGRGAGRRRGRARRHLRRAGGQRAARRSTPTTSPRRTACSSAGPTAATSARRTSCSCPCRPGRWTTRRSPRSPSASRRPTSASTSTASPRSRCRSSTCGPTRSGSCRRSARASSQPGTPSRPRRRSPAGRPVVFAGADGAPAEHDTPFYERSALRAGNVIAGPAIVEQLDSTTVVPPGTTARVLPDGAIIIDLEEAA